MALQPFSRSHHRSLRPLFPRVGFLPSQHQSRVHLTTTPDPIATTLTPCRFFSLISRHSDPFCWHAQFLFVCTCKDWVQVSRLASCFACTIRGLRMAIFFGTFNMKSTFSKEFVAFQIPMFRLGPTGGPIAPEFRIPIQRFQNYKIQNPRSTK